MNWIYSRWWKWLCVVLLIYVVAGSFFIPLGPGVTKVSPVYFGVDSVYTFEIRTFHTHFKTSEAGEVKLWFKNGNQYFCPSTEIVDETTLRAKFAVLGIQNFQHSNFDVVVNDQLDGTFSLREAISLIKPEKIDTLGNALAGLVIAMDSSGSLRHILADTCSAEVLHNQKQFASFPYREILYETIRNTFFHVPMWFVMTMLVFASFIASIMYLLNGREKWDILAHQSVVVALLFGACGYFTGLVWAKYTWYIGVSWGDVIQKLLLEDVKMAAALIAIIFYIAYLVLRGLLTDRIKSDRIAAAFNILAFVVFIMCVFVLPRLTDSMHPGNGGNPAFSKYDLDSTLRMFFYPAVIGWILLGFWILSVLMRMEFLEQKQEL